MQVAHSLNMFEKKYLQKRGKWYNDIAMLEMYTHFDIEDKVSMRTDAIVEL